MGQALYRKYRSKSLDEVVGQRHISQTLNNALKNQSFSHAYLFTGPKGVGKTSVARILAGLVNGLDYDQIAASLDIVEIDAASNRRIDEIRDLREKVNVVPSSLKYKVYIIDEVHMLTNEAFNALLKTLEEPPEHVIFILATTEAHKLPETIISRTQHFNFAPIGIEDNVSHLKSIADKEKISITPGALTLIAKHSNGSFRDSINLIQRAHAASPDGISEDDIQKLLGLVDSEQIKTILDAVDASDSQELVHLLNEYKDKAGYHQLLAKQLIDYKLENLSEATDKSESLSLIKDLLKVNNSESPETLLEVILLEHCLKVTNPTPPDQLRVNEAPVTPINKHPNETPPINKEKDNEPDTVNEDRPDKSNEAEKNSDVWPQVLIKLKQQHNTVYSIARMAEVTQSNDNLFLSFTFPFHYKRMTEDKIFRLINETAQTVAGRPLKISCVLAEKVKLQKKQASNDNSIESINNIFGEVEVLES